MDKKDEYYIEQIIAQNKVLSEYTLKALDHAKRVFKGTQLPPYLDEIFRDLRNRHSKSLWRF